MNGSPLPRSGLVLLPKVLNPTAGESLVLAIPGLEAQALTTVRFGWWADVLAKVLVIDPLIGADELRAWGAAGLVFGEAGATNLGLLS